MSAPRRAQIRMYILLYKACKNGNYRSLIEGPALSVAERELINLLVAIWPKCEVDLAVITIGVVIRMGHYTVRARQDVGVEVVSSAAAIIGRVAEVEAGGSIVDVAHQHELVQVSVEVGGTVDGAVKAPVRILAGHAVDISLGLLGNYSR